MYEDQPPFGADDKCRALYFGPHPLGRSVLGTRRERRRAAGRGDARLLPAALQPGQHRAGRAPGGSISTPWWPPPSGAAAHWEPVRRAGRLRAGRARATAFRCCTRRPPRSSTCCSWPPARPPKTHDRYAAKLLATVLGDDSGSRLYWELVDPGPGRTRQPEPLRVPGRRHDDDLHELRPGAGGRQSAAHPRRLPPGRGRGRHRRPNWSRPRARSARGSCSPASGPAAGCSPWAATGSTAASIARSSDELDAVAARHASTSLPPCWRSIRSPAPPR